MTNTDVNLTNCDREPIHIPGSIQAHGCLLACDTQFNKILRHSTNAADVLGLPSTDINGVALGSLLGGRLCHDLHNAIMKSAIVRRPALLLGQEVGPHQRLFDIAAHIHNGTAIIEFEPIDQAAQTSPIEMARALISQLHTQNAPEQIIARVPRLLQALLGYDRVMIYQFAEDGSGKVVSEAKTAQLESLLGQHFPASDIPKQARELYKKNTIRVISSSSQPPVTIDPAIDASGQPLDLSYAHLRSVSPIHIEYLQNMGVAASMSISILVEGELWGLIACHHYKPRVLSMGHRVAAEMFGEFFSLYLEASRHRRALETSLNARRKLDVIIKDLIGLDGVGVFLGDYLDAFADLIPCDGVGVFIDGVWTSQGQTPDKRSLPSLTKWIGSLSQGRVWTSHELASVIPNAEDYAALAAGALVIPLSQVPRDYLMFFRKEQLQTIEWAGKPRQSNDINDRHDLLTPRKSFAIWKQTVKNQSLPWSESDRQIAETIRSALLEVILRQSEVLASERRKSEVRQKILNDELNHRVKNILALIKSLVSQTVHEKQDILNYVATLKGRIMALAVAHDQIIRTDGGGNLHDLIKAEISPYKDSGADIVVEGPKIGLDARAYSVMALVLHELTTNAAKYGALSVPSGRLSIEWSIVEGGDCELKWQETGGPIVRTPSHQGFGSVLLSRSIPFDLGGSSDVHYAPSGVIANLRIPGKFVITSVANISAPPLPAQDWNPNLRHLQTLHILLVEDQLLIAMDVETMLAEAGITNVQTAASVGEALRSIAAKQPDVAILDFNLGSETSVAIAEDLVKRNVPFIFATGYGDSVMIPPSMRHLPMVRKPYSIEALTRPLLALVSKPEETGETDGITPLG